MDDYLDDASVYQATLVWPHWGAVLRRRALPRYLARALPVLADTTVPFDNARTIRIRPEGTEGRPTLHFEPGMVRQGPWYSFEWVVTHRPWTLADARDRLRECIDGRRGPCVSLGFTFQ